MSTVEKRRPLMIYLIEGEREAIRAAAEKDHRSMSDWARVKLLRSAKYQPPSVEPPVEE